MTLGNMRANGVRSLAVSCWQCHHQAVLGADPPTRHSGPVLDHGNTLSYKASSR
jgi:hypothetical protein